eukprot:2215889-Rhodomonas_salina.2
MQEVTFSVLVVVYEAVCVPGVGYRRQQRCCCVPQPQLRAGAQKLSGSALPHKCTHGQAGAPIGRPQPEASSTPSVPSLVGPMGVPECHCGGSLRSRRPLHGYNYPPPGSD